MGMSDTTVSKPQSMMWPLFYKDVMEVGNKNSPVGICTLWSKKESVVGKLDKESYCVIANLYTTDGINYIIKNVLANPRVKHIVLFGSDMMKTGEALMGLVRDGVDAQNKIKNTNSFIDTVIAANNLELFRSNIKIHDLRDTNDIDVLKNLVNKLNLEDNKLPFAEPQYILEESKKVEGLDTGDIGHLIKGNTISEVWLKIINTITKFGGEKNTQYGMPQIGVMNLQAVIRGEEEKVPEWLNPEVVKTYVDKFFVKEVPPDVRYTYPNRLFSYKTKDQVFDQIASVIQKLKDKPYTRQAIAVIWNVEEDMNSVEPPCLVTIWWSYKEGKLHQTANFRSHDMFRGWPSNTYALRELQKMVAKGVGMEPGTLTIISNDAHIYRDCWEAAYKIVETHCWNRRATIENDVRGYFLINTDVANKEIIVQHVRNDGKKSKYVFKGTEPDDLLKLIANEGLTQDIYHNMYLGKEVQRAKDAIDSGKQYIQDAA